MDPPCSNHNSSISNSNTALHSDRVSGRGFDPAWTTRPHREATRTASPCPASPPSPACPAWQVGGGRQGGVALLSSTSKKPNAGRQLKGNGWQKSTLLLQDPRRTTPYRPRVQTSTAWQCSSRQTGRPLRWGGGVAGAASLPAERLPCRPSPRRTGWRTRWRRR